VLPDAVRSSTIPTAGVKHHRHPKPHHTVKYAFPKPTEYEYTYENRLMLNHIRGITPTPYHNGNIDIFDIVVLTLMGVLKRIGKWEKKLKEKQRNST
jgi:hypothetical protein